MKTWGVSTVSGDAEGHQKFEGYVIHKAETAWEALQFANTLVTGVSYLVDEVGPLVEAGLIAEDYDHLLVERDWHALEIRAQARVLSHLSQGGQS